jgi:hypothetical protein
MTQQAPTAVVSVLREKQATLAGYRVQARGMASLFDTPPPKWVTPTSLALGAGATVLALGATKTVFKALGTAAAVGGLTYLMLRFATKEGV